MDEIPTKVRAESQKICPTPELGAAGDSKPCVAGMVMLDRVGYEVQPVPGALPAGTKKLRRIITKAGHMNQYDSMFSFGKAMSLAPIMSGIRKLPKDPARIGMMTKKIMIVACMLKSIL